MIKTLYIIRGIPGAGKNTLADSLGANLVCSEDDYWTQKDGSYTFSPETREEAFSLMFEAVLTAIYFGDETIAVTTAALDFSDSRWTTVFNWARSAGYQIFPIILQRNTNNPPSIHGLSESEMDRFRHEMEHGLEVEI